MENTIIRRSLFTRVNGKIMKNMDMEKNTSMMVLFIVDIILII